MIITLDSVSLFDLCNSSVMVELLLIYNIPSEWRIAMKKEHEEYEMIQHSKIRHLGAFVINITYRNFHMHSDFELLLIAEGSGNIQMKNDSFAVKPGDVILIHPHEMHEIDSHGKGLKIIILQFSRHTLNDYFPFLRNTYFHSPRIKDYFAPSDYACFLQTVTELAFDYVKGEDFFVLRCLHLFTEMLMLLYENVDYEFLNENAYQERKKKSDRVNRISAYIDENYLYPIRLQDIAEQEQISTTHLSHFFADNFGITFQEYLSDKRLEQALQLAENGDYSLTALSELSGFSDPKYLNKAFLRKFGYPFQEYKKNVRQSFGKPAENAQALQYYYTREESLEILHSFAKRHCLLSENVLQ